MKIFRTLTQLAVLAGMAAMFATAAAESPSAYEQEVRPLMENYCYKCHGSQRPKGGVNLSTFTNLISVYRDPRTWQTVLSQLRERVMPPDGKPQPSPEERDRLTAWVEHTLNNLEEGQVPRDPGRVVIHRLNRTEYNNSIRDLLGVDTKPADKFPADGGGGGGFDNNADTLFIPPILMEKYLEAAADILDQAKPERIFISPPSARKTKQAAAREIAEHFAMRAFRRPAEKAEIERLMTVYEAASQRGDAHEDSVKRMLKAVLASPNFLFRIERDRDISEPYPVNDYELAARLSYFLWSSMPDDELFQLAGKNRLRDPQVLEQQVRRMLQDAKAKELADNFAGQWLGVRTLVNAAQPDRRRFASFTPSLRDAMTAEAIEFFHSIIRDDASVLNLIDAEYTFVNEELAKHYGLEGVEGSEMRKVKLTDRNRGGVLGMAGMLTLTSYPQRTSPVLRGKWILEEIFGTPPPPPPPMVKSLPQNDRPQNGLSFRQSMEQHREKPECATCHKRMDPLGFSLENFDAIGRWRTEIGGQPVDATGVLPTGEQFAGPIELKATLLKRKDEFVRNLTEKMLAYALGRGLEYYDITTVKKITRTLAENEYRSITLITEIVRSFPFQYRRNAPVQVTQK